MFDPPVHFTYLFGNVVWRWWVLSRMGSGVPLSTEPLVASRHLLSPSSAFQFWGYIDRPLRPSADLELVLSQFQGGHLTVLLYCSSLGTKIPVCVMTPQIRMGQECLLVFYYWKDCDYQPSLDMIGLSMVDNQGPKEGGGDGEKCWCLGSRGSGRGDKPLLEDPP